MAEISNREFMKNLRNEEKRARKTLKDSAGADYRKYAKPFGQTMPPPVEDTVDPRNVLLQAQLQGTDLEGRQKLMRDFALKSAQLQQQGLSRGEGQSSLVVPNAPGTGDNPYYTAPPVQYNMGDPRLKRTGIGQAGYTIDRTTNAPAAVTTPVDVTAPVAASAMAGVPFNQELPTTMNGMTIDPVTGQPVPVSPISAYDTKPKSPRTILNTSKKPQAITTPAPNAVRSFMQRIPDRDRSRDGLTVGPTHADRLAMLSPDYVQDPDYGTVY